jgi:hypothetical protein
MLPKRISKKLQIHLEEIRTVHKRDLIDGWGAVQLPKALARTYRNAATERGWQWAFPSIGAGKIQLQNNRDAIISIRV